jgi:hypothetical protein
MAGFLNYLDIDLAYEQGRVTQAGFRKTASSAVATTTGVWFDISMLTGLPVPNYYASAPYIFNRLAQSTDGGLYHGGNVSPATKCLKKITIQASVTTTATPLPMIILDYLGYYPFIDMAGVVTLNSGSGLSRYINGNGVRIMAVLVAPDVGNATFSCSYTNQLGVPGRTTPTVRCTTQAINGTIVNSGPNLTATYSSGPFVPLQAGDTGVRSIESITWGTEDVGLISLVLVKPIATICLDAIATSVFSAKETDYVLDTGCTLPVILDDAYLNFICMPTGTIASAVFSGMFETIWSA